MNKIDCSIAGIQVEGTLHDIRVSAGKEIMRILTLEPPSACVPGNKAVLLFKETEVMLSRHPCEAVSVANRIVSNIKKISRGKLFFEVDLTSAIGEFKAVVFSDWGVAQEIMEGIDVTALIRATDIVITPWREGEDGF